MMDAICYSLFIITAGNLQVNSTLNNLMFESLFNGALHYADYREKKSDQIVKIRSLL